MPNRVTSYTRAPKKGTPAYAYWLMERNATFDSLRSQFKQWAEAMYASGLLDEMPEPEYRIVPKSKPFDWAYTKIRLLLIELDGISYDNASPMGHQTGRGYDSNCRKHALAIAMGFTVIRITGAMLKDGTGYAYLERALGIRRAA